MRNKSEIWKNFGVIYQPQDDGGAGIESIPKSKYCKCSACDEPIIAASGRLRDHWNRCSKRPRAIGQLEAGFKPSRKVAKKQDSSQQQHGVDLSSLSSRHLGSQPGSGAAACSASTAAWSSTTRTSSQVGLGAFSPSGDTVNDSSFFSGDRQHFDSLKAGEVERLNVLFSRAIHRTAMPYSAFDHPAWKTFFHALRSCYQLPTRNQIGGELMMYEYTETMNEVLLSLGKNPLICFTLDGATNLQGKQVINMMACVPKAFFLEHFTMQLRRESAANLLEKLLDCKLRLLGSIRLPAPGYTLSRNAVTIGNADEDKIAVVGNNDVVGALVCLKNEHFLNPPMFTFCSDSPSVMLKLRKDCLESNEFVFAYGCAPHAIHNLCMDLIKHFPGVTLVLKQILYMVKTLKSSHLLLQLFDKLCLEKYKKVYTLILFTKTRWGTVYYAAKRASAVKTACASLPGEILNSDLDIDMCDKLKTLVTDPAYWKGVAAFEVLFRTISSCLSYLKGDEATFSSVYACFVAIKYHLKTLDHTVKEGLSLNDDDIERMTLLTHHRLATIYSEAHALAFATDPMFTEMRIRIGAEFGEVFLQLGKTSINHQAKIALARLASGNDDLRRKMFSEFATYITRCNDDTTANDKSLFDDFEDTMMKPSELWTLCDDSEYRAIKHLLSAVHRNPAGASGGERNHKSAKQVHSRMRARLGTTKVETGTAIHFNAKQLHRQMTTTRGNRFCMWLRHLGAAFIAAAEDDNAGTVEDEIDGVDDSDVDEFNHLNLTGGVDTIADEDIFLVPAEEGAEMDLVDGIGSTIDDQGFS